MPLGKSSVILPITESMTRLKSNADITQPCLTPVFNFKPNFTSPYTTGKDVVVALDELGQFLEYAICSKYAPKAVPLDPVESFLEINKVDVELSLPLRAFLNDVTKGEDLVNAAPFFVEACLLITQFVVKCF